MLTGEYNGSVEEQYGGRVRCKCSLLLPLFPLFQFRINTGGEEFSDVYGVHVAL